MQWFVPTFYGDIKVTKVDAKTSKMEIVDATPEERRAIEALSTGMRSKRWLEDKDTLTAWLASGGTTPIEVLVKAPVEKVSTALASALKPSKKLVSAVKFSNGRIEEVTESTFKVKTPPPPPAPNAMNKAEPSAASPSSTVATTGPTVPSETPPAAVIAAIEPKAATTVAKPERGCPPPDFSPARLRARRVLMEFLTPEQREDFEKFNRFVTFGGTTGHRYMLTSRVARDELQRYQRTLFDLDDQVPLCVHDWDVPPEEELHALNILVQLPGYEAYLRHLETP